MPSRPPSDFSKQIEVAHGLSDFLLRAARLRGFGSRGMGFRNLVVIGPIVL